MLYLTFELFLIRYLNISNVFLILNVLYEKNKIISIRLVIGITVNVESYRLSLRS